MEWELIGVAGRRLMERLAARVGPRAAANDNVEAQLDLFSRAEEELRAIAGRRRANRRKRRRKGEVATKPAEVARKRPAADDRSHRLPAPTAERHVE